MTNRSSRYKTWSKKDLQHRATHVHNMIHRLSKRGRSDTFFYRDLCKDLVTINVVHFNNFGVYTEEEESTRRMIKALGEAWGIYCK